MKRTIFLSLLWIIHLCISSSTAYAQISAKTGLSPEDHNPLTSYLQNLPDWLPAHLRFAPNLTPSSQAFSTEEWVATIATGGATAIDVATANAVDADGNYFVVGYSANEPYGTQWVVIKYTPDGTEEWISRIGDARSDNIANDIEIDALGNIYVTGTIANANGYWDGLVVKYDQSGNEVWRYVYNPSENGNDQFISLELGIDDSIVLAGIAGLSDIEDAFAVVKLDSDGVLQWSTTEMRPDSVNISLVDMALDSNGNSFLGASVVGAESNLDMMLLKFTANGDYLWAQTYNGSADLNDWVVDVETDAGGNAMLIGSVYNTTTFDDFAVLKYDTDGALVWTHIMDGGQGASAEIALCQTIDNQSNIYVGGYAWTDGGRHAITIKLDSAGTEQWRYESSLWGRVFVIDADTSGNVYFAGEYSDGFGLTKLSESGSVIWDWRYDIEDKDLVMAVHEDGTIYTSTTGLVTGRWNQDGTSSWSKDFEGVAGSDEVFYAMTIDDAGAIFAAGRSDKASQGRDYLLSSISAEGTQEWVDTYDRPSNFNDIALAVTVDNTSNVLVTGYSVTQIAYSGHSSITIKYDAAGTQLWAVVTEDMRAVDITTDSAGNVYVAGATNFWDDFRTIKFAPDGTEIWTKVFNAPEYNSYVVKAINLDSNNDVVVGGFASFNSSYTDIILVKYDADGNELWNRSFARGPETYEQAEDFVLDAQNNIYAACTSEERASEQELIVVKFDAGGNKLWDVSYDSISTRPRFLIDEFNHLYVGAAAIYQETYFVAQFDTSGALRWRKDLDEFPEWYATQIQSDKEGGVYVTGPSSQGLTTFNFDAEGIERAVEYYHGPPNTDVESWELQTDAAGNPHIAAAISGRDWRVPQVVKYNRNDIVAISEETAVPRGYELSQNYPNPFNPTTSIRYYLPQAADVQLNIYNIVGQHVQTLVDNRQPAGGHTIIWDARKVASGIYFYQLSTDNFAQTRKMMLIK